MRWIALAAIVSFGAAGLCWGYVRVLDRALDTSPPTAISGSQSTVARLVCPDAAAANYFVPLDTFVRPGCSDERVGLTDALRALGQRSLSCGESPGTEAYRFVWVRSFHPPMVIRAVRTTLGADLFWATPESGRSGSERGPTRISPSRWAKLERAIDAADLWRQPTIVPSTGSVDGAVWVFEARKAQRYLAVVRSSPGGALERLGRVFIELCPLPIPDNEIY